MKGCKKTVEYVLLAACVFVILGALLLCAAYLYQRVEIVQIVNLKTATPIERLAVEVDLALENDNTNWTIVADHAVEWRVK